MRSAIPVNGAQSQPSVRYAPHRRKTPGRTIRAHLDTHYRLRAPLRQHKCCARDKDPFTEVTHIRYGESVLYHRFSPSLLRLIWRRPRCAKLKMTANR